MPKFATLDIRVTKSDVTSRRDRAARAMVHFLRRTAELRIPQGAAKDDLIRAIWFTYFEAEKAGLVETPNRVKRILRQKYGIWSQVGIAA